LLSLDSRRFEKHKQASRKKMLLRKLSCYYRDKYFDTFVEEAIKNSCSSKEFLNNKIDNFDTFERQSR
jgi:hypothetical protein